MGWFTKALGVVGGLFGGGGGGGSNNNAAAEQTAQVQAQQNARIAIAQQQAETERLKLEKQEADRIRAMKDKQYQREHEMRLNTLQHEQEVKQRQIQAEMEKKSQNHKERLKQMQIDAEEKDKTIRIQQKNKTLSNIDVEIDNLNESIESDTDQLEIGKKALEKVSKEYDSAQQWIQKFDVHKHMELGKISDKLQLETAKQNFENDDKQIKSAINKCGQVEADVGRFLSLTHCLLGATVATTAHSNQLDARISTFGELMSRECQDKLTIEQYLHEKNLSRFIPILEKETFMNVCDLKCKNDEEYDEIMAMIEREVKKANDLESKNDDNEDEMEEKEEVEGAELVKELLTSWNLAQYYDAMINYGGDDPIDWKELCRDDLQDMQFRPLHIARFLRKYKEWRMQSKVLTTMEQRLMEDICRKPETWEEYEVEQTKAIKEGLMTISPLLGEFFTKIHEGIKHSQEILEYGIGLNPVQQRAIETENELLAIEYKNDEKDDIIMDDARKEWNIDSKCEIYSSSHKKWCDGVIFNITNDDDGEWLHVKYTINNRLTLTKEIQRSSAEIREINVNERDTTIAIMDYDNRELMSQCRALTTASIRSIDVTDIMIAEKKFDEDALSTRALSVARGVEDCCMQIIKSQSTIRQSVLLAQEILKMRPAYMSDEAKVLWKAVDDGVIRIFKTAINMVKISSQYFGYFLRFKQGFKFYESNRDKSLMISLQYLKKDMREFTEFKKNFTKTVQELSNEAMDCIKNCVVTHVGAKHFETARSSRERTLKKWLEQKAIYDKHSVHLDYELDEKQQQKIELSAEKARLTFKVSTLEAEVKRNQDYKKDYMATKDLLEKLII